MISEPAENKKQSENTVFEDFDSLAVKAIDEALSTLGEKPKTAIYSYLNSKYHIDKKGIPQRIEDFSKALEDLLKSGAAQMEILCREKLFFHVKKTCGESICEWITPKLSFKQYVQFMEQQYKKSKNVKE
ncbi:MAG: hypothetical protein NWE95_08795 [Candidatus Bathyarchaeota archaeon]|nr:hypothetical protein [Candidatus Bathyarchaeota archaeon]